MRRFLFVGLVMAVAVCGSARTLTGSTANGAKVTVRDLKHASVGLTDEDVAEIEKAAGQDLTFFAVEVDNRRGDVSFEWRPYYNDTKGESNRGEVYDYVILKWVVRSAGVSDGVRALFDDQVVPPKSQGAFVVAFPSGLTESQVGAVAVYQIGDKVLVRCE